jgi:cobalamin biosynthetic protein CobC
LTGYSSKFARDCQTRSPARSPEDAWCQPGGVLAHGGRLRAAAHHFAIPLSDWLDLSTGINPLGWPVPPLPAEVWQRLPEDDDGLEAAARDYYGAPELLPVAGSQAAIQALPRLRAPSRVAVLTPGYAEHAAAWRAAGHQVRATTAAGIESILQDIEVLVVIHPNNPTGERFASGQLHAWHQRLSARGGWLVIDEAFMDATPAHSLAAQTLAPGLIVLRSLGKFFGLAGLRVGFVLASPALLAQLRARLGPWSVSNPARWVATAALRDHAWQQATRQRLHAAGARLTALLEHQGFEVSGSCAHFAWMRSFQAQALWSALARQGILTRLFCEPASLRLGLPGSPQDWHRLEQALAGLPLIADRG